MFSELRGEKKLDVSMITKISKQLHGYLRFPFFLLFFFRFDG